jgi:HD-like signal output (HDOD) protein
MTVWLLTPLLLAALALLARPVLRSALRRAAPAQAPADPPEPAADPRVAAAPQVPEGTQGLDHAEIFGRLRQLQLGISAPVRPLPQHEHIVTAALVAIGDPTVQRRYFPRRPNLLPKLMHAVRDENASRRQLAAIVADDPSLVDGLLRMANSPFYRIHPDPIETIEGAIALLGCDGLRSLIAAALMQPIFQVSDTGASRRFPELVWEHTLRSAHAAAPYAALIEKADPFAAELLALISGLAEIVLFRVAMDHCAAAPQAGPLVIASLLDSQSAVLAWRIGAAWQLSAPAVAALEAQTLSSEPATPLGRALRFGRRAAALALLYGNALIDDTTVRESLPETGRWPRHLDRVLTRLLYPSSSADTVSRPAA